MRVGVDIVEIARIQALLDRWGGAFLTRVYTEREQNEMAGVARPGSYLAGRWAAKEAVIKALGVPCAWTDLEITRGKGGEPELTVFNRARQLLLTRRGSVTVSISHAREHAVAVALLAGGSGTPSRQT